MAARTSRLESGACQGGMGRSCEDRTGGERGYEGVLEHVRFPFAVRTTTRPSGRRFLDGVDLVFGICEVVKWDAVTVVDSKAEKI